MSIDTTNTSSSKSFIPSSALQPETKKIAPISDKSWLLTRMPPLAVLIASIALLAFFTNPLMIILGITLFGIGLVTSSYFSWSDTRHDLTYVDRQIDLDQPI